MAGETSAVGGVSHECGCRDGKGVTCEYRTLRPVTRPNISTRNSFDSSNSLVRHCGHIWLAWPGGSVQIASHQGQRRSSRRGLQPRVCVKGQRRKKRTVQSNRLRVLGGEIRRSSLCLRSLLPPSRTHDNLTDLCEVAGFHRDLDQSILNHTLDKRSCLRSWQSQGHPDRLNRPTEWVPCLLVRQEHFERFALVVCHASIVLPNGPNEERVQLHVLS